MAYIATSRYFLPAHLKSSKMISSTSETSTLKDIEAELKRISEPWDTFKNDSPLSGFFVLLPQA
jgi:hypothetical protein